MRATATFFCWSVNFRTVCIYGFPHSFAFSQGIFVHSWDLRSRWHVLQLLGRVGCFCVASVGERSAGVVEVSGRGGVGDGGGIMCKGGIIW